MKDILASLPEGLGVGASAVAVLAAAIAVYRWSVSWYRWTVGSRRDVASRLNPLAAGVTTRWIEERLGPPAFVRSVGRPTVVGRQAVTELIYRTRHAWVQVIADAEGAVIRFSITVTGPKFAFRTRDLTLNHLRVKLGRSRFADIQTSFAEPEGFSLRIGAHNREYSEAYYFGNPGNYQRLGRGWGRVRWPGRLPGVMTFMAFGTVDGPTEQMGAVPPGAHTPNVKGPGAAVKLRAWSGLRPSWRSAPRRTPTRTLACRTAPPAGRS
jgi:hypothetical protein